MATKRIVHKTFANAIEMHKWLADERNIVVLEKKYPKEKYSAEIDLTDRQVIVKPKTENDEPRES